MPSATPDLTPSTPSATPPATATTAASHGLVAGPATAERYLSLLKACLTRTVFETELDPVAVKHGTSLRDRLGAWHLQRTLDRMGLELARTKAVDRARRDTGRDHPRTAETMIGLARLDNIEHCVTTVLRDGVPGDLIETGVWRGGATIFMRAILEAYGDATRKVWVADSFAGLPKPDAESYPVDAGDTHWTKEHLAISVEQVRANFARYGLLDDRVRFLEGWFKDTLPTAPIEQLAVMRLDGDMYESTIQALDALYPKLSVGGFVIIDDYGDIVSARQATEDFRSAHGIDDPIVAIDHAGVYWRRSA